MAGLCERLRTIKRSVTKKLVKSYVALFLAMFTSSYAITMMFPFAPFLVRFLLPHVQETDVGNYVGMLASAMFFGRFLASYIWGVVSDKKGRKPVIIVSLISLALSTAFFGFSTHFAMAIIARFIVGITNGVVGTAKAIVSEISDDSTQALGVTIISTSWGMGFIIGPAMSGAISDPIGQYNLNITNAALHSFLTKFPYSLPCLLNTILCLIAALVTFFLLSETKGMKKNRRRSEINRTELQTVAAHFREGEGQEAGLGQNGTSQDDDNGSEDSFNSGVQRSLLAGGSSEDIAAMEREDHGGGRGKIEGCGKDQEEDNPSKRTVLHTYNVFISNIGEREGDHSRHPPTVARSEEGGRGDFGEGQRHIVFGDEESGRELATADGGSHGNNGDEGESGEGSVVVKDTLRSKVKSGLKGAISDLRLFLCSRSSSLSLFIYCVFSFGVIGQDEVYSLWAFTSAHHGGLGFTLYQIGISLSVAGALMLPASLIVFPLLERYVGLINSYYFSVCVCIAVSILFPNLHYLVSFRLSWLLWIMLCLMKFIIMVFISASFASTILLINNSVTFDKLGAINGLAVSMTAITRTIAPIFAGSVFAASLSPSALAIGFPFNYNLVFVIFGAVFLSTIVMATCLPASINKQKIIEDVDSSEVANGGKEGEGEKAVDNGEGGREERETAIDDILDQTSHEIVENGTSPNGQAKAT